MTLKKLLEILRTYVGKTKVVKEGTLKNFSCPRSTTNKQQTTTPKCGANPVLISFVRILKDS